MLYASAAILLGTAVLIAMLIGVRTLLKDRGTPKNLNRTVTLSVYFIAAFLLFGSVAFLGIRAISNGLLESGAGSNRFLLAQYEVYQHVDWRQDQVPLSLPSMDDTVTEIKLPFL